MNKNTLIIGLLFIFSSISFAQENVEAQPSELEKLIINIQSKVDVEKRFDFSRANSKEKQLADLKKINKKLESDLKAAEDLSTRLIDQFDKNEKTLSELEEKLTLKLGNLGEMFGVVKQVSGQTRGEFKNSITNIDNPDRDQFLKNLAESKKLPDLSDISSLWVELVKEIRNAESIKVFNTNVVSADGTNNELEILRIGTFSITHEGMFLKHLVDTNQVEFLPSQPTGVSKRKLKSLQNENEGTFVIDIDPTRGAILDKLIQKKTFFQRISDGGLVGYVIILLGLAGVALAGERIYVLKNVLDSIKKQEESDTVDSNNLLGMLIETAKANINESLDSLELILDEKVQSITPTIEVRVKAIKLIATVAPLLGLLGTVIGMIETFQAITLFGTGDPKLMAGGISQALVTTMLGLIVAAPLLFMHSYAENYSKTIISFLEEKASGIVANKTKKMITDIFKTYSNFIYQGGPVVFILFLISIYLFVLIFAKFKYLFFDISEVQDQYKKRLSEINNDEFYLLNLSSLKCDYRNIINKDFFIIQTLIALCPVLGLLGTVTGMIEVFDVVSFFGTGNARALASGITKATLPTMTGMAISIVGLLTYTVLNSKSQSIISEL